MHKMALVTMTMIKTSRVGHGHFLKATKFDHGGFKKYNIMLVLGINQMPDSNNIMESIIRPISQNEIVAKPNCIKRL